VHSKTDIIIKIFDIPSKGSLPFEKRMEELETLFGENGTHVADHFEVVKQIKAKNKDHVLEMLKEVEELGGEGLMLRKPKSKYEGSRSSTLLKVKTFYDAEAIVTGHKAGSGKNALVTGALSCKMACGKTFHVGSGLSDKQRRDPPKIGSIIVYRFQELTKSGLPR
jgi:DNA ligase 1